jgi:hypothetical protein
MEQDTRRLLARFLPSRTRSTSTTIDRDVDVDTGGGRALQTRFSSNFLERDFSSAEARPCTRHDSLDAGRRWEPFSWWRPAVIPAISKKVKTAARTGMMQAPSDPARGGMPVRRPNPPRLETPAPASPTSSARTTRRGRPVPIPRIPRRRIPAVPPRTRGRTETSAALGPAVRTRTVRSRWFSDVSDRAARHNSAKRVAPRPVSPTIRRPAVLLRAAR